MNIETVYYRTWSKDEHNAYLLRARSGDTDDMVEIATNIDKNIDYFVELINHTRNMKRVETTLHDCLFDYVIRATEEHGDLDMTEHLNTWINQTKRAFRDDKTVVDYCDLLLSDYVENGLFIGSPTVCIGETVTDPGTHTRFVFEKATPVHDITLTMSGRFNDGHDLITRFTTPDDPVRTFQLTHELLLSLCEEMEQIEGSLFDKHQSRIDQGLQATDDIKQMIESMNQLCTDLESIPESDTKTRLLSRIQSWQKVFKGYTVNSFCKPIRTININESELRKCFKPTFFKKSELSDTSRYDKLIEELKQNLPLYEMTDVCRCALIVKLSSYTKTDYRKMTFKNKWLPLFVAMVGIVEPLPKDREPRTFTRYPEKMEIISETFESLKG